MQEHGELIAEGKTKKIFALEDTDDYVVIESKDDITAGDGAKHDVIPGKAAWATETTSNVFRFLKDCNIPVAWMDRLDETRFLARRCEMIPLEVVIRREAYGSYLLRNPGFVKGARFPEPFVELFLKTTDRRFGIHVFPEDDPLLRTSWEGKRILVMGAHDPRRTVFGKLTPAELGPGWEHRMDMRRLALEAFRLLERQWNHLGCTLCDMKMEFGLWKGELLLADVIDNDSWRLLKAGRQMDKQVYREDRPLSYVAECYREVAELTGRFNATAHGDVP